MKVHEGAFYPSTERGLQGDAASLAHVEEHILPYVQPNRRSCIQAGGAVGLWARTLSQYFEKVHSFEPNPALLKCFHENTKGFANIISYPVALGKDMGGGKLSWDKDWNMGSWWVTEGEEFPIVTIDSLNLTDCDLILLDIEGAELEALKGARGTMAFCRPVIVVESKSNCLERYGTSRSKMHEWLREEKYRYVKAFHGGRDELWVPTR